MRSIYEAYKPLRNSLRQCDLERSLQVIWQLMTHLHWDGPVPEKLQQGSSLNRPIRELVFPWALDIATRELILNSAKGPKSIDEWNTLASVINGIRDVDGAIAATNDNIYLVLHRIHHQQLPWQSRSTVADLMRSVFVYEQGNLSSVFERSMGFPFKEYVFLGLAICGGLISSPRVLLSQDYSGVGISDSARNAFFGAMTVDLKSVKSQIEDLQQFDETWLYTFNPLRRTPIVQLDPTRPERGICPIPQFMWDRFTSGAFFDVVGTPGFANAFGEAFDEYVGKVLNLTLPGNAIKPQPYVVSGNVKHGTDWILSDGSASAFIECKGKRMRIEAKIVSHIELLDEEILVVAKAIHQNYMNVLDAIEGRTQWQAKNSQPVFNLVVTLEDWLLSGSFVMERLETKVSELLVANGKSPSLIHRYPFFVICAAELEAICCALRHKSIERLLTKKNNEEHRSWLMSSFLMRNEPNARQEARLLFADEFKELARRYKFPRSGFLTDALARP
jgi:hypothetical protein